jgi:hypothetical protein
MASTAGNTAHAQSLEKRGRRIQEEKERERELASLLE